MASETTVSKKQLINLEDEASQHLDIIDPSSLILDNSIDENIKERNDLEKKTIQILKKNNFHKYMRSIKFLDIPSNKFDMIFCRQFRQKNRPKSSFNIVICINLSDGQVSPMEIQFPSNTVIYYASISEKMAPLTNSMIGDMVKLQHFQGSSPYFQKFIHSIAYIYRHHILAKKSIIASKYTDIIKPKLIQNLFRMAYGLIGFLGILGILSLTPIFKSWFNAGFGIFGMGILANLIYFVKILPQKFIDETEWTVNDYSLPVAKLIHSTLKNLEVKQIFEIAYSLNIVKTSASVCIPTPTIQIQQDKIIPKMKKINVKKSKNKPTKKSVKKNKVSKPAKIDMEKRAKIDSFFN